GQITQDNLAQGSYYFVETSTTSNSWLDKAHNTWAFEVTEATHHTTIAVAATNDAFKSTVSLKKVDEFNGANLPGIQFTLYEDKTGGYQELESKVTDPNGMISFTLPRKGSYQVKETATLAGYQRSDTAPVTAEFTVTDACFGKTLNLKESIAPEEQSLFSPVVTNAVYKNGDIANERIRGSVSLEKTDAGDNTPLNDVTFGLFQAANDTKLGEFVTGNEYQRQTDGTYQAKKATDGTLQIEGLDWNNYYIQEVKSATGYKLSDKKYTFTIDALNLVCSLTATHGTITNEQTRIWFDKAGTYVKDCADQNPDIPGGGSSIPLAGSEFCVYQEESCTTLLAQCTSDAKGMVEFKKLEAGKTYYIKETGIPSGYAGESGIYHAVLSQDGTFEGLYTAKNEKVSFVGNKLLRGTVSLSKTGFKNAMLSGAEFIVYPKGSQTPVASLKEAGTTGTYVLDNQNPIGGTFQEYKGEASYLYQEKGIFRLLPGEYELVETKAPAGYKKPADTVRTPVTIKEKDDTKITLTNDPIVLTLEKTNSDWSTVLLGAEFSITPVSGSQFADGSTNSKQVTTENVTQTMIGLLVADSAYVLKETKAPDGYCCSEREVEFRVKEDGTFEIGTAFHNTARIKLENANIIQFKNHAIDLTLKKKDSEDINTLIGNVTFDVYDVTKGGTGTKVETVTTGTDAEAGIVKFKNLIGGHSYQLIETAAPLQYQLLGKEISFQVRRNGTLSDVTNATGNGATTLLVTNQQLTVG
ncbi:MAG: SpaA isopeptide-forming pilin-related protein, partial [Lachnospiraceae bacterium]